MAFPRECFLGGARSKLLTSRRKKCTSVLGNFGFLYLHGLHVYEGDDIFSVVVSVRLVVTALLFTRTLELLLYTY